MEKCMKGSLIKTWWTEKACLYGEMEEDMKVTSKTIRCQAMENSSMQMADYMKDNFWMGNSMALGFIL